VCPLCRHYPHAYHTSLYVPFTAESHHFQRTLNFLLISGSVELTIFVLNVSCSAKVFQFNFREAAERYISNKRAVFFMLIAGVHITNDLFGMDTDKYT
jgi:hypothetical protein